MSIKVVDEAKEKMFETQLEVYRQIILKFMEEQGYKPDTLIIPALYQYKKEYEDVLARLKKKYKLVYSYDIQESYAAYSPHLVTEDPDKDVIPF